MNVSNKTYVTRKKFNNKETVSILCFVCFCFGGVISKSAQGLLQAQYSWITQKIIGCDRYITEVSHVQGKHPFPYS